MFLIFLRWSVAAGAVAYTPKSGFGGGYSLEGIIPVLHE
jgi:hypothetical protein